MHKKQILSAEVLKLDCEQEARRIAFRLRELLKQDLKRRGYVVAISGGIDSSVTAALCIKAVGKERILTLQMPERHSEQETASLCQRPV